MTNIIIRLSFVISLFLFAGSAAADFWGGCIDALGRAVPDRANYSLNDIAVSRLDPLGRPVIEYNPNIVLSVNPATRRFFYLHECGHHALGQVVTGQYLPMLSEQAADCWAAKEMNRQGLSLADLRAIQNSVAKSPGDWAHLPGPKRALNLEACLQGAVKPDASKSAGEIPMLTPTECKRGCDTTFRSCTSQVRDDSTACLESYGLSTCKACGCPNWPAGNFACYNACKNCYEGSSICQKQASDARDTCKVERDDCKAECASE